MSEHVLSRAHEALDNADWSTAKKGFEDALAAEETPEALEGFATAAFFLEDSEPAIAARERAYSLYRESGRPVDAARVATSLAWDYRSYRGERAIGDGWLARARRLLDGSGITREQGWLALREASFALPDEPVLARERCAAAETLGRQLGDTDLEMTAIALDGLARVNEGEIAAGMARLDEATTAATAGEMRDPVAIGFSCCYLIFACERVRDFERAGQWCQRVADMAAGWNIRALRSVCRAHYGTVLMLRGEWQEAETVLSEAVAALAGAKRESSDALARLAELRWRQGRTEEALAAIGQAEHHPIAVLVKAAIAFEGGDTTAAVEGANRYLRLMGGATVERAAGLELLAQVHAAAGHTAQAEAAAQELRTIAQAVATDPLLGASRLADGAALAAAGRFEEAREALEDAVQLLVRAGLPFESARARVALAQALRGLGREEAALREVELASERFAELGAAREVQRAAEVRTGGVVLSAREREVLELVSRGLSNRQIAAELTLSEHTVHRHVANILVKLRVPSRAAAAALAARHGLVG
jgi:LuxR family transcriptional regulator, maltose regulon positive regulatory protein